MSTIPAVIAVGPTLAFKKVFDICLCSCPFGQQQAMNIEDEQQHGEFPQQSVTISQMWAIRTRTWVGNARASSWTPTNIRTFPRDNNNVAQVQR